MPLRDAAKLAQKLGLLMIADNTRKHPPRYTVNDQPLRDVSTKLPPGDWQVLRFAEPPRLVPRSCV